VAAALYVEKAERAAIDQFLGFERIPDSGCVRQVKHRLLKFHNELDV